MSNKFNFIKKHKKILGLVIVILIIILSYFTYLSLSTEKLDYVEKENQVVENANSYTEAVKKSDVTLCEEINNEKMRETCISITQGKIDFANSQNLSTDTSDNNLE